MLGGQPWPWLSGGHAASVDASRCGLVLQSMMAVGCEPRDEAPGLECDPRQSSFVVARLRQTAGRVLSFDSARPCTATSDQCSLLLGWSPLEPTSVVALGTCLNSCA